MDPELDLKNEDIESYEIYLPIFKNACYNGSNKADVSLSLFSCKSYEDMRKKTNDSLDLKIVEELERLAMDEKFLFEYDEEVVRRKTENSIREESYQNGLEEGITQGEKQKQMEIAKSMLADNVPIEEISRYTKLSTKEINNLEEEH